MRFSQRIGRRPIKDSLQLESMDTDTKNALWNAMYTHGLYRLEGTSYDFLSEFDSEFVLSMWQDLFKFMVDSIPGGTDSILNFVRGWFVKAEWDEALDFTEFFAQFYRGRGSLEAERGLNSALKREMSAYRLIDGFVAQITSEGEIAAIEAALESAGALKLEGVREHLLAALVLMSDRKNPDYRNSIKESISAVESLAMIVSGDPKAELGKALRVVETRVAMHGALTKGFLAIYGYTSDEGGIRHAMLEVGSIDFEDAKYMLASCSAFVSYLIVKASKAGIPLS